MRNCGYALAKWYVIRREKVEESLEYANVERHSLVFRVNRLASKLSSMKSRSGFCSDAFVDLTVSVARFSRVNVNSRFEAG